LSDELVGCGPESHPVTLDEDVAILVEAVHEGLEVFGEDAEEAEEGDQVAGGDEVGGGLFDQGVLEAVDGRDLGQEHLEASPLEGSGDVFDGWGEYSAEEGLDLLEEFLVFRILGVEFGEADPLAEGQLGSGLHHTEELLEQGIEITATNVGECLHFIDGIKGLVLEVQRQLVEVSISDLETVFNAEVLGILVTVEDLGLLDIDACHSSTGVGGNVGGDAAASATDIQDVHSFLHTQILHHFLLEESLIAHDTTIGFHKGRDVHLLYFSEGAELIEHGVVVLDLVCVLGGYGILLEESVGLQKVIDHVLGHRVQSDEGADYRNHAFDTRPDGRKNKANEGPHFSDFV